MASSPSNEGDPSPPLRRRPSPDEERVGIQGTRVADGGAGAIPAREGHRSVPTRVGCCYLYGPVEGGKPCHDGRILADWLPGCQGMSWCRAGPVLGADTGGEEDGLPGASWTVLCPQVQLRAGALADLQRVLDGYRPEWAWCWGWLRDAAGAQGGQGGAESVQGVDCRLVAPVLGVDPCGGALVIRDAKVEGDPVLHGCPPGCSCRPVGCLSVVVSSNTTLADRCAGAV
jgi:hypothetical protein